METRLTFSSAGSGIAQPSGTPVHEQQSQQGGDGPHRVRSERTPCRHVLLRATPASCCRTREQRRSGNPWCRHGTRQQHDVVSTTRSFIQSIHPHVAPAKEYPTLTDVTGVKAVSKCEAAVRRICVFWVEYRVSEAAGQGGYRRHERRVISGASTYAMAARYPCARSMRAPSACSLRSMRS